MSDTSVRRCRACVIVSQLCSESDGSGVIPPNLLPGGSGAPVGVAAAVAAGQGSQRLVDHFLNFRGL